MLYKRFVKLYTQIFHHYLESFIFPYGFFMIFFTENILVFLVAYYINYVPYIPLYFCHYFLLRCPTCIFFNKKIAGLFFGNCVKYIKKKIIIIFARYIFSLIIVFRVSNLYIFHLKFHHVFLSNKVSYLPNIMFLPQTVLEL